MNAFVIVATKGRAQECYALLDYLAAQSLRPSGVVFVGVDDNDIDGLSAHPAFSDLGGIVLTTGKPGLTIQRNFGVSHVLTDMTPSPDWFVAFFDDDFRPSPTWLENASKVFAAETEVAGLTGQVLADGIHSEGLSETAAAEIVDGGIVTQKCWAQGDEPRVVSSMYGCNMAVRGVVFVEARFDERLPLYGWQEDRDFTSSVQKYGRTIYHPDPLGVHLGVKSARTSGTRMGYSQIANIIYLKRKGSVSYGVCAEFLSRAIAANLLKSFRNHPNIDYPGRLRGNFLAFADAIRGKMKPERILSIA
ncbi:MAG: glycosyltransferase [Pseudomonadota bacterium]